MKRTAGQLRSRKNQPSLWLKTFPFPTGHSHKYTRGHAMVVGGPLAQTGAARLAARGALRIGSGLVTVVCDHESLPIYASSLTAVMTRQVENEADFLKLLNDTRCNAFLIGPGCGVTKQTLGHALAIMHAGKSAVLDADALSVFAAAPKELFDAIASPCILTPHEKEFERLFARSDVDFSADRVTRVMQAAAISDAVVVLKGAQTIIASPEGRIALNDHASPFLATAGSGDVLAGFCLGLLAQGMPAFEAACASVWIHGEIGLRVGAGLIAEDISEVAPAVLNILYKERIK